MLLLGLWHRWVLWCVRGGVGVEHGRCGRGTGDGEVGVCLAVGMRLLWVVLLGVRDVWHGWLGLV